MCTNLEELPANKTLIATIIVFKLFNVSHLDHQTIDNNQGIAIKMFKNKKLTVVKGL